MYCHEECGIVLSVQCYAVGKVNSLRSKKKNDRVSPYKIIHVTLLMAFIKLQFNFQVKKKSTKVYVI